MDWETEIPRRGVVREREGERGASALLGISVSRDPQGFVEPNVEIPSEIRRELATKPAFNYTGFSQ